MQTQNNTNGLTNPNQELVKVTKNQKGENIVSARDLYDFLEIKERFSTWCIRMLDYGFEEGLDFTSAGKTTLVNNGASRDLADYALTLDTAKEIAMLQRSYKGKQARRYFIDCEKQLRTLTDSQSLSVVEQGSLSVVEVPKLIEKTITLKEFNTLVKTLLIDDKRYYKMQDILRFVGINSSVTPNVIHKMFEIPNQQNVRRVGPHPRQLAVYVDMFAMLVFLHQSKSPLAVKLITLLNEK